ncbi:hypothetical protein GCM10017044_13840 [Kordiimonas sediminis]|uniref:TIGR02444 family protein n=2 Tax=Kordiimonas sediminis TaxID=1735581 RepID=A0A919AQA1_9PROT|nr:hypothetical protein GCM10017044_13840 [Kordiimonas sediminis]
MKDAFLDAQDRFGMDINLALLFLYLDQHNKHLTGDTIKELYSLSHHWQSVHLAPLRQRRRSAQGTADYDDLKAQELRLEKQEQKALVAACKPCDGSGRLAAEYLKSLALPQTLQAKLLKLKSQD